MRSTLNISLPKPLKQFVEQQVASGAYSTASEYVREVLRKEQVEKTRAEIDAKLIEGLDSGPATKMTKQDWEWIRREGMKRIAAKRRSR